jgi:hypothetical protein
MRLSASSARGCDHVDGHRSRKVPLAGATTLIVVGGIILALVVIAAANTPPDWN